MNVEKKGSHSQDSRSFRFLLIFALLFILIEVPLAIMLSVARPSPLMTRLALVSAGIGCIGGLIGMSFGIQAVKLAKEHQTDQEIDPSEE